MVTGGNHNNLMSDINVTPFVDVMLVLLVIFMVTAPMMVQGLNVDLPEVAAKALPSDKEHLIITIDAEQKISINEYEVSAETLKGKLSKILETRVDRDVYLKADKNIPYGMVVKVMADVKAAGVDKLGMVTDPVIPEEEKDTD
jgi:biopolymer transport protein TolR